MFDHHSRSIWSVRNKNVMNDVLTSDLPGREVRNKKRHFTVSQYTLFPPSLTENSCFTVLQGMQFEATSKLVNVKNG
jgi:hypothetical protein